MTNEGGNDAGEKGEKLSAKADTLETRPPSRGNGTLSLFKKITIIGGALIVLATIVSAIIMVSPTTTALSYDVKKNTGDIAELDEALDEHVADAERHVNVPALEQELAHIKSALNEIQQDLKTILRERRE